MLSITEADNTLRELGARIRRARISMNESMQVFAKRIGVSVPTLRGIEQGEKTVKIGHWFAALWALGAMKDFERILMPQESLFDRLRVEEASRRRPYKRHRAPR